MVLDAAHLAAMVFAAFRLTELVTMDRISEPLRRRFPHYLWSCGRCVSIWAAAVCLAVYFVWPYGNWIPAMSALFIVKWDWKGHAEAAIKNRVQAEVERLALQELDRQRRTLDAAPVLRAKGWVDLSRSR